jgi:2-amino-4-hydroxy-6-hydroxymethyldihydropteridine diphosphokinase
LPCSSPSYDVFIGLGSNLAHAGRDCRQILLLALAVLESVAGYEGRGHSSCFVSAPVGEIKDQPDFYNAVARGVYQGRPLDLLTALQTIENRFGRQRLAVGGPRTLDLDLLVFGTETINTPELTIPHPRLQSRAFVLLPLWELAPGIIIPGLNKTSHELWQEFKLNHRQRIKKISWQGLACV